MSSEISRYAVTRRSVVARTLHALAGLSLAALIGGFLPGGTRPALGVDITINSSLRHQTIEGFGSCLAWWINSPYDQDAFRTMYARDMGSSVLRMEFHPNVLVQSGFELTNQPPITMDADVQANINKMNWNAQGVKNFGDFAASVNLKKLDGFKLIGSLWSPPHWMKTSSGPDGSYAKFRGPSGETCGGHLIQTSANLTQFARYCAAFVKGMEQKFGVPVYAISLQNELVFTQNYNSCVYYSTGYNGRNEYVPALKAVAAEFRRLGITTKIQGPEDVGVGSPQDPWVLWRQFTFITDVRADPQALSDLSIYSIHGYAGNGVSSGGSSAQMWSEYWNGRTGTPSWTGIKGDGKPSWMTETSGEHYDWLHTNSAGNQDGAFTIGVQIHEALVNSNISLWAYWQMADAVSGNASAGALTSGTNTASKKYVAAKHFFRYIRPGAVRVETSPSVSNGLNVSAYVHDANKTVTIVLVNNSGAANSANITLPSSPSVTTFNAWRSSSSENFVALANVTASAGRVSLSVPAYSMVTLYGTATTTPPPPTGSGSITRDVWNNITGTAVSAIPVATTPSSTGMITSLEGPTNVADNYGTRIRGYITAPTTGSYTFWVAGDDDCELYLSTNDQAASKVKIASVVGWTNSREWNKYPSQKSTARTLTAGQRYYVEVLHKEGNGGDNVAVGWLKPGQSGTVPSEVVPGSQLSPWATTPPPPPPTGTPVPLNNPGFETGTTSGWIGGGQVWGVHNLNPRSGSYNAYNNGGWNSLFQNVNGLSTNTIYTLKVWARLGTAVAGNNQAIYISTNGGSTRTRAFITGTGYQQYTITFNTGTSTSVQLGSEEVNGSSVAAYLDDFELVRN